MAKDKNKKRPSLIRFTVISLFWLSLTLALMGKYWGVYWHITKPHTTIILYSLLPSQKQQLANALNHHYTNTMFRKYTKGLVLSCEPNVKSIQNQFNWFYRNTLSSQINELPGYHRLISETLYDLNGGAVIPVKNPSTLEFELALIEFSKHKDEGYTEKDARSDFLTTVGLGMKYVVGIAVPEASLAVTTVSVVHDMMPDPEKLVPAIHCLHRLRLTNWMYSSAILWALIMLLYLKRIAFQA